MASDWLSYAEAGTFVGMVGTMVYNRLVSWRRYETRTSALELRMSQHSEEHVQAKEERERRFKEIEDSCHDCRSEVVRHHQAEERHVTKSMLSMLEDQGSRLTRIEDLLMKLNGHS